MNHNLPIWRDELNKVPICRQRQDSTQAQLKDLIHVANRFGFYDAADRLKILIQSNEKE